MEKLIEDFRNIINTSIYACHTEGKDDWCTEDINSGKERCAELCKQVAIDFATYHDSLFATYSIEEKEKWFNEFLEEYAKI
jgi:hypothetical protein